MGRLLQDIFILVNLSSIRDTEDSKDSLKRLELQIQLKRIEMESQEKRDTTELQKLQIETESRRQKLEMAKQLISAFATGIGGSS